MKAISLFSGAGGMDVGFRNAGFNILWANELDKNACATYEENHGSIVCDDINNQLSSLTQYKGQVDVIFGGPPCQGFSVAGKMDPDDERSKLLWSFLDAVKLVQPQGFVCENVKALGVLEKWQAVREKFIFQASEMGYKCDFIVLMASDFNVPQNRERVFFIGYKNSQSVDLNKLFETLKKPSKTVRSVIQDLGPAGNPNNSRVSNAKITIAAKPILRKSPYAGMLFNGLGRPVKLDGFCSTLPASMGGNKTPIIDEDELYKNSASWVEGYHRHLMGGNESYGFTPAPERLRRLTIDEASLIQTFPKDYVFKGSNSSIYTQIGNAVPCNLAFAVANGIKTILNPKKIVLPYKLSTSVVGVQQYMFTM